MSPRAPSAAAAPRALWIVFAKWPEPGRVKTRMCPPLREDEASELYAAMLDDVLESTARFAAAEGVALRIAVHPPESIPAFEARVPAPFEVWAQQGPDLAARMAHAVERAAAEGFGRIGLRGSDSPALPTRALAEGIAALSDVDLCVGPDLDGGYSWIALRGPVPGLFDHPMSTTSVLDDTLANAAARGLRTRRFEPHFDLDRVEDLRQLRRARLECPDLDCPRTLALLDARDHWRHLDPA